MSHRKAPPVRHDDPFMTGQRSRNNPVALRRKRTDTRADTIEEHYHVDLGVRGDKTLGRILQDEGVDSLSALLRKKRGY